MIHLVLGGARSGKSTFAENWCLDNMAENTTFQYIATATPCDDEMATRIKQHQNERNNNWQLHECPLALATWLSNQQQKVPSCYLIECLTLWLNNVIYADSSAHINKSNESREAKAQYIDQQCTLLVQQLVETSSQLNTTIVCVSNEVGLGIIPLGADNRLYVDSLGRLNQAIARVADHVTLVTAGIPLHLKHPTKATSTR